MMSTMVARGRTISTEPGGEPAGLRPGTRLYAGFVRGVLWPLMNRAYGRSIDRRMRFLDRSQWWTRARLEVLQARKLRRLVEHAYLRVPFYRREMRARGLRPENFTSPAMLRHMPLVTKAMLVEDPHDFLAEGARLESLVKDATGGSTNQPATFYRSREQDSWHWALKYRMWGMAGYRLGLPYVNIYNMRRRSLRKRVQDRLLRNCDFYLFEESRQDAVLARMLDVLSDPDVRFLAGCTTTIRVLAEYRAALAHPPPIHLQAILSTGSLLTQRDRAYIERHLAAPMWDHYDLGGEGAHVAAECEVKRGYHVNAENMIIEPAEPGCVDSDEATEIYLTVLDNHAWPLIRYVTGDRAVFTSRSCPCGRGLPLLERIDGRVSEVLRLPNGVKLNTHYFSVILAEVHDIDQYQVEQTARDVIVLRIVWRRREQAEALRRQIASQVETVSAGTVRVQFEDVAEIPRLPSGKHRFIIALPEDACVG